MNDATDDMAWFSLLLTIKAFLVDLCLLYALYAVLKVLRERRSHLNTARWVLGAAGLIFVVLSLGIHEWLFTYLVVEKSGAMKAAMLFRATPVGFLAAVCGLLCSLWGLGWVRNAGVILALVMVCDWWEIFVSNYKADALIIGVMIIIAGIGTGALVRNTFSRRRPDASGG